MRRFLFLCLLAGCLLTAGSARAMSAYNILLLGDSLQRDAKAPAAEALYGYWHGDRPLYALSGGQAAPTGASLGAGEIARLTPESGGYYRAEAYHATGYLRGEEMLPLEAAGQATALRALHLVRLTGVQDGLATAIPADTPVWFAGLRGEEMLVRYEGAEYLATPTDFYVSSKDTSVTTAAIKEQDGTMDALLDGLRQSHGQGRGQETTAADTLDTTIEALQQKSMPAQASSARQVDASIQTFDALMAEYHAAREASLPQKYYLHVNKASRQLTIYLADSRGNRTDAIYKVITVAIGKRTTPTPSGLFILGGKEEWHYFGPSYAPYAISFGRGGRSPYLHGPLYREKDVNTVYANRLSDFGQMATGGCVRIPYEDIQWIYQNCESGDTVLEIVNGE